MRKNTKMNEEQYWDLIEQFYSYFETGYAFEEFLKLYLEKLGLDEVTVTQRSRDGGVDLLAKRVGIGGFSEADDVEYYIQAKRYGSKSRISVTKIRELKGTIPFGGKGVFITTAGFSSDAKKESANDPSKPVILIDGRTLIESCVEKGIGFSFVPQFSKVEMDRLTKSAASNADATDKPWKVVEKQISASDIRAQILRIPRVIRDEIPPDTSKYVVSFNNDFTKELSIDKYRVYFAKVIDVYQKYGLIDAEGVYYPKKAIWNLSREGNLNITLRDLEDVGN